MELITSDGTEVPVLKEKSGENKNPWDQAHDHVDSIIEQGEKPYYVEPDVVVSETYVGQDSKEVISSASDGYLKNWPRPEDGNERFAWHLGNQYSQLKDAYATVLKVKPDAKIKIAIIDTGYHKGHPFLPQNLHAGVSYIRGEEGEPAYDTIRGTLFEQEGHGTATLCLLAGKKLTKDMTGGLYEDYFGGIPFAEVLPIRICETVALIRTKAFVDAVKHAISEGCEVISMSMAGAPTKAWAEVVNLAYDNGVVLVSAAGNNWFEGAKRALPKRVLYPARWERVIAATGVSYDHLPYNQDARLRDKSEGGETMQGNYGPDDAMLSAIAAYTPNVVWATLNEKDRNFRFDGGGTSSATPQVAAAASLWLAKYRDEINAILNKYPGQKWRKVEMVKKALFSSSDKNFGDFKKFYGNGILKAEQALKYAPDENVNKAEKAKVSLWGILDLVGLLLRFKGDENEEVIRQEMFETEIMQEVIRNKETFGLLDYETMEKWNESDRRLLREKILNSDRISTRLKEYLQTDLDI